MADNLFHLGHVASEPGQFFSNIGFVGKDGRFHSDLILRDLHRPIQKLADPLPQSLRVEDRDLFRHLLDLIHDVTDEVRPHEKILRKLLSLRTPHLV